MSSRITEAHDALQLNFRGFTSSAWIELILWSVALLIALAFVAIKVRAWGGVLDAPEQGDFESYYLAARVAMLSPADLYRTDAYARVLNADVHPAAYLYAPTYAWLMQPLAQLPYEIARRIWFWASVVALLISCALLLKLSRTTQTGLMAVALFVLLPSTLDVLFLGQVDLYLTLLLTLAVVALCVSGRARQLLGGIALGIAGAIKFFPLALLLMACWKRKSWFGIGAVVGVFAFMLAGVLVPPGWGITANESIFAFWRKLSEETPVPLILQGSARGELLPSALPPAWLTNAAAYLTAFLLAFVSLLAWWRLRGRESDGLNASALWLLLALMVAPVTWWHYATISAPMFPALIALRAQLIPSLRVLIPAGYMLMVAQRGMMLWLPLVAIHATSSLMLFGFLLWWLAIVMYARGVQHKDLTDFRNL